MNLLFDIIGMGGMACILLAYYFLQKEKFTATSYPYLTINLAGGVLLLISLLWHWNMASFLLECAWVAITGYGIYKRYRKDRIIS